MRIPSVSVSTFLLLTGLLGVSFAQPLSAWAVQCGDKLISAGTVVLDADLTCPNPDLDADRAGLEVFGDTILDLNGHTISCGTQLGRAIRMGGAVLRNGTIANCPVGLYIDGQKALVEHVVFTHNIVGVRVNGGHGNTLRNNTASENEYGFAVSPNEEDDTGPEDNVLIDNVATRNSKVGFAVGLGRHNRLLGNTASLNGKGFVLNTTDVFAKANVAEENLGVGFEILGDGELEGNIARRNGGEGFVVDGQQALQVLGNTAYGNGGDGFFLPARFFAYPRVLRRNVALNNGGHGVHVAGDKDPRSTILDNTAVGQMAPFFDLADDNPGCRGTRWKTNLFETSSQTCVR
jgi:parallel beta-helix repeat protein